MGRPMSIAIGRDHGGSASGYFYTLTKIIVSIEDQFAVSTMDKSGFLVSWHKTSSSRTRPCWRLCTALEVPAT